MTIPKRLHEVLEEVKVAIEEDAADAQDMTEAVAKNTVNIPQQSTAPTVFNSVGNTASAVDKITELVQEFGLTAGGNKLTTWE